MSAIFKAKCCAKFRGIEGNVLGRCLEIGLFNIGFAENTEPKLTGADVTIGVFNEADAAAKDADSVATLGRGGGIMGLLLLSSSFFGEGGPSNDELESNVESNGSAFI